MSHRNIILIGPMGSGKSTIGNIIAKKLQRQFYDSDHFIEDRTGVDIARIFDVEG
jgi:shikimate kinase